MKWFWKRESRDPTNDELKRKAVTKRLDEAERRLEILEAEVELLTGKKLRRTG